MLVQRPLKRCEHGRWAHRNRQASSAIGAKLWTPVDPNRRSRRCSPGELTPIFGAALVALVALVACNSGPSASGPSPNRTAAAPSAPLATRSAQPTDLGFIELTTGGAAKEEALPLVIAIHGLGDRPEDFAGLFAGFSGRARVILLRGPDAWGSGYSWFPFSASDSDETRARTIASASERVATAVRQAAARRPTRGKPIVTGFSQGGMLSFAVAARHPDLVRAALPIGGVLPEPLWPRGDAGASWPHIVALHGESDHRVPVEPTRRGVEALRARGWDARLESFPGVGHGIPPVVRARFFELLQLELTTSG